jgi:hypothetical protein
MDKIRFLFDECVPATVLKALLRLEPSIDSVCVGGEGGPIKGTLDPALLEAATRDPRILVTRDKKTMPGHLIDFYQHHEHSCGLVLLKSRFTIAKVIEDLYLMWAITTPEEWVDRTEVIPYGTSK